MLTTKFKYNFSKIKTNNINNIDVDYYLNILLCNKSINLGYLQYVSNDDNNDGVMGLIKGELNHDITLENPSYILPQDNNVDYYGDLIASSIITGITNSNLITSIKSYDKNNPYPIGSRVIDGQTIEIIKENNNYIHYTVDLIDYITYFNHNDYSDSITIIKPTTFSETQCNFKTITTSDKYNISINYNTTNNNVYSSTTTNIIVFINGLYIKPIPLPLNLNGTFRFDIDLDINDNVSLFYSSSTNNNITFSGDITYTIEPTDIDNEQNYITYYFFGSKTLNRTNTTNGFLYKSDKQHYHEKPIINNNIKVDRNNISVFKPIFDLGTINFIGDF